MKQGAMPLLAALGEVVLLVVVQQAWLVARRSLVVVQAERAVDSRRLTLRRQAAMVVE